MDGDKQIETPPGVLASLQRMADSLLGLAQNRIELFGVELQEERLRGMALLLKVAVALTLGVIGILVGVAMLALLVWSAIGYAGLGGLALLSLAGAAFIYSRIRKQLRDAPEPFAGTINEFRKDRECLRKTD